MKKKDTKDPSPKELMDYVRRGMVFTGILRLKTLKNSSSVDIWLEEADITVGVNKVRALLAYTAYAEWCKTKNLDGKAIASIKGFSNRMHDIPFHSEELSKKVYFYLSKPLSEYEKDIEKYQVKSKKKTDKTST